MASAELEQIYQMVDNLNPREKQLVVKHINDSTKSSEETESSKEPPFTAEEIKEMLKPKEALTGKEMVERGFIGGWEDMGIEDSVEWLEQQKARRRNKHQW